MTKLLIQIYIYNKRNFIEYKLYIKFFFSVFIFIYILSLSYKKKNNNGIKICLCAIGKYENKYILEFVEHYKKYNIDKIFLYDNNDINGEKFEDILSDYIKLNFIEIIPHRGEKKIQLKMYKDCYKNNYKIYDWLLFFDIDEFIYLKNYHNIKDFLIKKKFNKCQSIYLNWIIHTDNNLLYYDNRTLYKRFTEIIDNPKFCRGKSIIRGGIENVKFISTHTLVKNIQRCNGFGNIIKIENNRINCKVPDFKYFYIDHYYSKSTEEFINKINKGDGIFSEDIQNKYNRIKIYFRFNKITKEKIILLVKKAHLKFTLLTDKIKKIKILY